ncbi:hypothetical protein FT663_00697 [Candidozyma haemuli var. vulneris]|uniref:Transcription factor IWS1 n=1 Tax=Candidozyma haemuli TaxID=45357 RepID=A0A2V1ANJ5_9ASCO|nr:hypothetical protein CXQ85_003705 [[Candida] haemuloni]KAF3992417.1 hypothetical protein FT662_01126 [[Candida] haemuloni var. vulneris]KAF3995154.1 hypothetical protein FT663_00697 [[Candida] haemuloni var. vulneris]PVH19847.1 hypothetical protein CXQ85_003705 [[Candida] haemuloni]
MDPEQEVEPVTEGPSASETAEQRAEENFLQDDDDKELPDTVGEENIEDDQMPENDVSGADELRPEPEFDPELPREDEQQQEYDDEDIYSMRSHKNASGEQTKKKNIRKTARDDSATPAPAEAQFPATYNDDYGQDDGIDYSNEDPAARRRRLLEEKMDLAVKNKTVRRKKADEDDLERMQDDKIDFLKNKMIEAANLDVEKNSNGQIATEKLKLLKEVMETMSKADLAISILDNNLLEAVRLWLEPLPDASMPAYQIQKELIHSLTTLPIKTDHLVASGIGKVLVFYQRSKRTEPTLKKIVDRLIGDWTRPILNKSDSYKDRTIRFHDYNKSRFSNQLQSKKKAKQLEPKSLYEQQAERRNRAAIPSARTTAYKIAPRVDPSLLMRQGKGGHDERFTRINRKMTNSRKKVVKKSGPSIEGKNLSM